LQRETPLSPALPTPSEARPQFEYLAKPIRWGKAFSNAGGAGLAVSEPSPRAPKDSVELDVLDSLLFNIHIMV
jgi:chromosome partitioning protein